MRAKEMEKGVARRSLRSNRTRSKDRDTFMKKVFRGARTIIYLNPDTKIGRESYVEKEQGKGWVFNHGQAYSTYKFHATKEPALKEMQEYAGFRKIKFKPGKGKRGV